MTSENPVTRSAPASSVAAKTAFTAGVLTVFLTSLLLVAPQRNSAAADTVSAAEFAQAVRQARQQAPYHVYAPTNLPANWRITSVHHRTDSRGVSFWHVGITTPTQHQIGVEQSDGRRSAFLKDLSSDGKRMGTVAIHGAVWGYWEHRMQMRDVRTMVRPMDSSNLLVTGSVPDFAELSALASTLR